jgi:RNA polymerase sigma-70 factor, ECF subfamily
MIAPSMGYLRPLPSQPPVPDPDAGCLEAFDRDLSYLFQTLQRLGASPREIEDLAQDVFMVLHKNWPTLDTSRPLRPYLFGVAFRVVAAHRRRLARETPHALLDIEDGGALSPEGSLQAKESAALLLAALDHIPLRRRAVLIMHDLDSVSVADISRKLSISRFGTYARLRKARTELAVAIRRLSKGAAPTKV